MAIYAILSDIHGNYEALKAVERDARQQAGRAGEKLHFVCLGDVVDYGPQPNECAKWVKDNVEENLLVLGNHDGVAASTNIHHTVQTIQQRYWPITIWTWLTLDPRHREWFLTWHRTRKLETPLEGGSFTLFHGSLAGGVDGRLDFRSAAQRDMDDRRLRTHYGLFGHTHYQGYFEEQWNNRVKMLLTAPDGHGERTSLMFRGKAVQVIMVNEWQPLPRHKALFNPGSVGQPRYPPQFQGSGIRSDYRASYMLIRIRRDRGEFCFRRVDYDVDKTVRQLRQIQWPTPQSKTGSDILHGRELQALSAPAKKRLREIWENGQEELRGLVDGVLVPLLYQKMGTDAK